MNDRKDSVLARSNGHWMVMTFTVSRYASFAGKANVAPIERGYLRSR